MHKQTAHHLLLTLLTAAASAATSFNPIKSKCVRYGCSRKSNYRTAQVKL